MSPVFVDVLRRGVRSSRTFANVLRLAALPVLLLVAPGVSYSQTAAEALDIPGWSGQITLVPGGRQWRVITGSASSDNLDALTADTGAGNNTAELRAVADGPGLFSYSWKISGQKSADNLTFEAQSFSGGTAFAGASSVMSITGTTAWKQVQVPLPPGRTTLIWKHTRSGIYTGAPCAAWLDQFSFVPSGTTVSPDEALDQAGVAWTVEGDGLLRAVRTGALPTDPDYVIFGRRLVDPSNQTKARLKGALPAGWFSFRCRSGGSVKYLLDGVEIYPQQALSGWPVIAGRLGAPGTLTIEAGDGTDVWLDHLSLRATDPSVADVLDAPAASVTWEVNPNASSWRASAWPHESHDDVDALVWAGASGTGSVTGSFTGPAEVKAWVRSPEGDNLDVLMGNVAIGTQPNSFQERQLWREQTFLIPPGSTSIRWQGKPAIDDVRVTPFPQPSVAEAVDSTAFSWTGVTGQTGSWYPVTSTSGTFDGTDALWAGPGAVRASSTVAAAWSGAGTFRCRWRKTGTDQNDLLTLKLEGGDRLQHGFPGQWRALQIELPERVHTAAFTAACNALAMANIDAFSFDPGQFPFRTALDSNADEWISEGTAAWAVTNTGAHTGASALASPVLAPGDSAILETVMTGPGTVKFFWKSDGTVPVRAVDLTVGYASPGPLPAISAGRFLGDGAWHEETIPIPAAGPQKVRWIVKPLAVEGAEAGAVLLDNVRIFSTGLPSALAPALTSALEQPGRAFSFTGLGRIAAAPAAEAHDGSSAVRIQPSGLDGFVNEPSSLKTSIDGPFELTFWWRMESEVQNNYQVNLLIDGTQWTLLNAASLDTSWKKAIVVASTPGPHEIEWQTTWRNSDPNSFWLDGLNVKAPGAAGSFTSAVDNTQFDWAIPDAGTGHIIPDAAQFHDGASSARFGADNAGVRCWVNGPGTLTWWWRQDIPNGKAVGAGGAELLSRGEWQQVTVPLREAGRVSINWSALNGIGVDTEALWLDNVQMQPGALPPLSIGDVLNSPELEWVAEPLDRWGIPAGMDRVVYLSPLFTPIASLSVVVTGPGLLAAIPSEGMQFSLDGINQTAEQAVQWPEVGAGTHTARWTAVSGMPFLDKFARLLPLTTAAEGMDLTGLAGISLTNAPAGLTGVVAGTLSPDGKDMAITAPLGTTPSNIAFQVTGPCRLRFRYSSVARAASLSGTLDGVALPGGVFPSWPDTDRWVWADIPVPSGVHTLNLAASPSGPTGPPPRLLLDSFRRESESPVPASLGTALDHSGLTWTTRADLPFSEVTDANSLGGSAAGSPALAPGAYTWLETTLNGPGIVVFDTSANNYASPVTLTMQASWADTVASLRLNNHFYISQSGPVPFRISFANGGPSTFAHGAVRRVLVDNFHFIPDSAPAVTLTDALDEPALTWTTPAGSGWRGIDAGPRHGDMAVAAGGTPAQTKTLALALPGPGKLTWRWMRSPIAYTVAGQTGAEATLGLFDATANRLLRNSTANFSDHWETVSQSFIPQQTKIEFRAANVGAAEMVAVDIVTWEPAPARTFAEVLECSPSQVWTSGGDAPWWPLSGFTEGENTDYLISGLLIHNQSAWIETTVTPPVDVRFTWNAFSQTSDKLTFSVNGTFGASTNGQGSETHGRRFTGTTPVTLRWTYAKDASVSSGLDSALLYNVEITPASNEPPGGALDSTLIFTSGSNAGVPFTARTDASLALRGDSMAVCLGPSPLAIPPFAQSWLDTTVTGPGLLTLAWRGSGFALLVDGVVEIQPGGPGPVSDRNGWQRVIRMFTDSATHQIRVRCDVALPGNPLNPQAVDDFRFEPFLPFSALNTPEITWTTGNPAWVVAGEGKQAAVFSSQSASGPSAWIEAAVTGPGIFSFVAGGDSAAWNIDGITANTVGGGDYFRRIVTIPAGAHRLRWTSVNGKRSWLRDVSWETQSTLNLSALLHAPDLVMIVSDFGGFGSGTDLPLQPGRSFLTWKTMSPPPLNPSLEVIQPAAGRLTISASLTPDFPVSPSSNIPLAIDGGPGGSFSIGVDQWYGYTTTETTAAGLHRFSLQLPPGGGPANPDAALVRLDDLKFVPRTILTAAEATESTGVTWGAAPAGEAWFGWPDRAASHDGNDVLAAALDSAHPQASASATITGPAVVTFWWKASGARLKLTVDGQEFSDTASDTWKRMQLDLGTGLHQLNWKAVFTGFQSGAAWLDQFTSSPPGDPSLLSVLGPSVPALLTDYGEFVAGIEGARVFLRAASNSSTQHSFEFLAPGPSVVISDYGYPSGSALILDSGAERLLTHEGLALVKWNQFSPEGRLSGFRLRPLITVSLQEAIDSPWPVLSAGNWKTWSTGPGGTDFAWLSIKAGDPNAWIEITVPGPGILSRGIPSWDYDSLEIHVDGVRESSPSAMLRLTDSRNYTVRWTKLAPNAGDSEASFDSLMWGPLTSANHFPLWIAGSGLTGASALPDADPDNDGRSNLTEFAFGGNPALPGGVPAALKPEVIIKNGTLKSAVQFTAREAPLLYYELEMPDWHGVDGQWTNPSTDLETLSLDDTWRTSRFIPIQPLDNTPRLLRIRARLTVP